MSDKTVAKTVIVLGGGILGVSTAWQLAQAGAQVTLVTEAALCSGATGRSLSWLNSAGERSQPYHALRMAGIDRYRTLFARHPQLDWLRFDGAIYWAADDDVGTKARHDYEKAQGYDSKLINHATVGDVDAQVNPASLSQVAIANPGEGWVSLPHLVEHLVQAFRALGGEVVDHAGKASVITKDGRASGIRSEKFGELLADRVLVACGPWTPEVVAPLGVKIPNSSPVSMLVTSQPCDHALQVVLNTPRAAVRPTVIHRSVFKASAPHATARLPHQSMFLPPPASRFPSVPAASPAHESRRERLRYLPGLRATPEHTGVRLGKGKYPTLRLFFNHQLLANCPSGGAMPFLRPKPSDYVHHATDLYESRQNQKRTV